MRFHNKEYHKNNHRVSQEYCPSITRAEDEEYNSCRGEHFLLLQDCDGRGDGGDMMREQRQSCPCCEIIALGGWGSWLQVRCQSLLIQTSVLRGSRCDAFVENQGMRALLMR